MRRYRLIEHTADTGIVAYGKSLPDAFANAAYGLFSIIADLRKIREVEFRRVELESSDVESLLHDWMNQLIYLFDVEHLIFKRCDIDRLTERGLQAMCWGEKYDPSRHRVKIGVKSATYHMLEVNREKNQVRVIFDI
ncbi:MAG: archease [Chloroflexi bacterium]|nr:archease [Chloroflexota bacterium]